MGGQDGTEHPLNHLAGSAHNVVQAGQLYGGVHIHQSGPTRLEIALHELAHAVRAQWLQEAARRGLLDPAPLAVS